MQDTLEVTGIPNAKNTWKRTKTIISNKNT